MIVLLNKTDLRDGEEGELEILSRTILKDWNPEAVILFSAQEK